MNNPFNFVFWGRFYLKNNSIVAGCVNILLQMFCKFCWIKQIINFVPEIFFVVVQWRPKPFKFRSCIFFYFQIFVKGIENSFLQISCRKKIFRKPAKLGSFNLIRSSPEEISSQALTNALFWQRRSTLLQLDSWFWPFFWILLISATNPIGISCAKQENFSLLLYNLRLLWCRRKRCKQAAFNAKALLCGDLAKSEAFSWILSNSNVLRVFDTISIWKLYYFKADLQGRWEVKGEKSITVIIYK